MTDPKDTHLKLATSPSLPRPLEDTEDYSKNLRDLMGLLALPALWLGRDSPTILKLTFEAIQRTLPLRCIFAQFSLSQNTIYSFLMWNGKTVPQDELHLWEAEFIDVVQSQTSDGRTNDVVVKGESLKIIKLSLGFGANGGNVWFGTARHNFPMVTELAFLRAATTLATTGIITAKAHKEAADANRAKDEFMAILGHELRNPLSPIMMSLDILRMKNGGELPKEIKIIDRQAKHLSRLVDDLLDVSRITSGRLNLKNDIVKLNDVINKSIENCTPLLNEKRHHLSKVLISDIELLVAGDEYRLIQVFTNLLNNAAKFMSEGGMIAIASEIHGRYIQIKIKDHGPGIASNLLPTVFNMFEQGMQTIDRSKGGLGIGLAVVKTLVELHQGRVQVESVEGEGATFSVVLPLADALSNAPLATADGISSNVTEKILIVDDNIDALDTLHEYLGMLGYQVAKECQPDAVLERIDSFNPDIVILDIGLPGISGYELAAAIRSYASKQPVLIALTGYGQKKDKEQALAAGFNIHLTKPISIEDLNKALTKLKT